MSITSKNGFRAFLIVSTLIGFGGLVDVIFPSLLSPELQEYFAKAEVTNYGKFLAAYSFIMSIIGLVSFIGILKFRKWARSLYVILTIVGLLFTPFYTEQISSGLSSAFSSFSSIASGIILALMYMPPVKEYSENQT
ncbi:hypothetical protein [Methylobacter sp.]|uniref:hypothetical protein n=1 Tax=Methylobacter sp. TaxID=2051955 RepID=UPI003DA65737